MRCFYLVTAVALVTSLTGCSLQHTCSPTCCPLCCEVQGTNPQNEVRDGLSAAQWAARVKGADTWAQQEIILKLASFGPSSLCYAMEWMGSEAPGTRYSGAELARMIGAPASPALPALRTLLHDKQPVVRIGALRALATFAKDDLEAVVKDLARALDAEEWEVRYHATSALAAAGYHAADELPHLEHRSHHDHDSRVRAASAAAFEAIEGDRPADPKARRGHPGN